MVKTLYLKHIMLVISLFAAVSNASAQAPTHLTTDLLEFTDVEFQGRTAYVSSSHPLLGWVMESGMPDTKQTAYRILVASSDELLEDGKADIWDSGKVESSRSFAVQYEGPALQGGKVYHWAVKTWDDHGIESPYSKHKRFCTDNAMDGHTESYPLEILNEYPSQVTRFGENGTFVAFERAAFGKLSLTLYSETGNDTVTVRLGEKNSGGRVFKSPKGNKSSIRYSEYRIPLRAGRHTYDLKFRKDPRNTDTTGANESGVLPLLMPDYVGEVYPFRFCEIVGYGHELKFQDVLRQNVTYPFNDNAASFDCSDSVLCRVWDLCKYTIKATSFAGIFVDGDRERIAYEADAIIGQLGHYCTDREYSLSRRTHEYLLHNPTWPTEWNLQSVLIAWNDYLYTGDKRSLENNYEVLKAKTLLALKEDNGLISTRTGKMDREFLKSVNFRGKCLRDIVDWPQDGVVGNEKERAGEADGFELADYNTVVNAFHYEAVKLMSLIASAIGNASDALHYDSEAKRICKQFNSLLLNGKTGHYRDGVGTDHESLHGNMFPLAFGLVPASHRAEVLDYVKSRRMACSVYGAQFLLEALYAGGEGDYALSLLASCGERSWYNMLRAGSTITMEAWDEKYKPNLDWNHVWGAVPANMITRGLFGIVPTEPGFTRFRITPQPGSLKWAKIRVPSISGEISADFINEAGKSFSLNVEIPANTESEIYLPVISKRQTLIVDGVERKPAIEDGKVKLVVGSGRHCMVIKTQ